MVSGGWPAAEVLQCEPLCLEARRRIRMQPNGQSIMEGVQEKSGMQAAAEAGVRIQLLHSFAYGCCQGRRTLKLGFRVESFQP